MALELDVLPIPLCGPAIYNERASQSINVFYLTLQTDLVYQYIFERELTRCLTSILVHPYPLDE